MFAANLEISQFAAFIVGDSCDAINMILEQERFDMLLDGDDKCFDLVANLKPSAWLIFTAAVMLIVITSTFLCIFHSCLEDKHALLNSMSYRKAKSAAAPVAAAAGATTAMASVDKGTGEIYTPLLRDNTGAHDSWRTDAVATETEVENEVDGSPGMKTREDSSMFNLLLKRCHINFQIVTLRLCLHMHLVRLVRLTHDDVRQSEIEVDNNSIDTSLTARSTIATVRNIIPSLQ